MINKSRLLKTLSTLISIDSQNPVSDERAIAEWVRSYLVKLGISARLHEFSRNRPNVLATIPGGVKKLLITPHLDTVPAGSGWHTDPLKAVVRAGKMYGLGATDCKCNLACALEALHSLHEDRRKLAFTLVFAATADEESGSTCGLIPLLDRGMLDVDAVVVLDTDDFEIIVAQKGLLHVKVRIEGKKAHGAYPWLGDNAIDRAAAIIADVGKYRFPSAPANKYLHPATVNTGTIHGGDKVNIVAGWCEFELDFRFLPGMSPARILSDLTRILRRRAKKFTLSHSGVQKPYGISEKHPLVACLSAAMRSCRAKPRIQGSEGATVITFFQDKKIPAIATGFGSTGCAHLTDEYVRVDNLARGALTLEKFLLSYKFD